MYSCDKEKISKACAGNVIDTITEGSDLRAHPKSKIPVNDSSLEKKIPSKPRINNNNNLEFCYKYSIHALNFLQQ